MPDSAIVEAELSYEAAKCLRDLCLAQAEFESHAACLRARVSSSAVEQEEQSIRRTDEQVLTGTMDTR